MSIFLSTCIVYKMLKLTLTLKLISFSFLKFDFALTLNVDWKQLLLSEFMIYLSLIAKMHLEHQIYIFTLNSSDDSVLLKLSSRQVRRHE